MDDGVVTGIRGRAGSSAAATTDRARLVVGADGRHSMVAEAVDAPVIREDAARSLAYYSYWDGVALDGGALCTREGRAMGAWPTNDGLVMTFVAAPVKEFPAFRADIEGHVLAALDQAGELGARIRAGRRAERWYGTADLTDRIRRPFGPGWALAGDAGLVMGPVSGQGIGHALRDADLLAEALVAGLGGSRPLEAALADYAAERDRQTLPMYEFTLGLAAYEAPRPGTDLIFRAIAPKPADVSRFLAVLGGVEAPDAFFSGRNIMRLVGLGGMIRMAMSGSRAVSPSRSQVGQ
jgi:2-polyprenyl-6-methoxyphenol hydroxylase-like FAD-dependent oxidoreductase